MTPIILDPEIAAFVGAPPGNLGDIDPLTGYPFICQNGVTPGKIKLAQFIRAMNLRGVPRLYSQEDKGRDALVYVKLFDPCGSWTWYVTEFSHRAPDGAENVAFGLVIGHESEIGYINLHELAYLKGKMGIGIEIDCWFQPTTIREIKRTEKPEPIETEVVYYH